MSDKFIFLSQFCVNFRKVSWPLEHPFKRIPPSTCDTIHPIDMIFGIYNELPLYFQLSVTGWCLIGFHGNRSNINDVTSGRHLGFLSFQILFKFQWWYIKMTARQHLSFTLLEYTVKLSVFSHFKRKVEVSKSKHKL